MDLGAGQALAKALMAAVALGLLVAVVVTGRRGSEQRSFVLAVAAALACSPIVWLHYFALLLVPVAVVRPRLGPLWFVPLAMWGFGAGTGNGSTGAAAVVLLVVAATFALAVREAPSGERTRKHAPRSSAYDDAGLSTTVTRSSPHSFRAPGSARKSSVWRDALLVDHDDVVAVGDRLPVGALLGVVLAEAVEETRLVDLEPHVVRDAPPELGQLPEEPVGVAVGGEHAHARRSRSPRAPTRAPRSASCARTRTRRGRARSRRSSATSAAAPSASPRLRRVRTGAAAPSRHVSEGDRQEHHAREREPRDAADRR